MMKKIRWIWAVLLAFSVTAASPGMVFAADKTVSSVSIRVYSKLEPGETLPSISTANSGESTTVSDGDICVYASSSQYHIADAEWVTSSNRTMDVGDKPEMKVRLEADGDYQFKGTYRSSNVKVKGGDYVSVSKDGTEALIVKLKVDPIEGDFGAPEDVYWKDNARGTAKWSKPDEGGTGKYEVVLRRGSTKVHTVETTATTYNFYPYMTQAGTYTFRVRTIAKTSSDSNYGKNSEWVESDEIYIAKEDVSDGSGRTDSSSSGPSSSSGGPLGNTQVGWRQSNGDWYYYYPDGSCHKNGWLEVGGKHYLFQQDGRMMRGWQQIGGYWYFLADSGELVTGWLRDGNRWYYLNPTQDQFLGTMFANHWLSLNGKDYYFAADGSMIEGWWQVDGNWYYFYPGAGNKAVNTTIDTFYVDGNGIWRR